MSAASLRWAGALGRFAGLALSVAGLATAALSLNYARTADAAAAVALSVLYFEQPASDDLARVIERDRDALSSPACNARVRSPDAVVRLNIGERDGLQGTIPTGESLASLRDALQRAASCTPTQAINWLGLAWLEGLSSPQSPRRIDFLRLAYTAAPREVWMAVRRLMAFADEIDRLPADLKTKALEDFRILVANGFVHDAYAVLVDRGWINRDLLLQAIADVDRSRRDPFAAVVRRRTGLPVDWPGDPPQEIRPWR